MKLVLITWLDATRTDENIGPTARIGITRETVGWLLRRDPDGVVLAMTRDNEEDFERGFTIPAPYVRKVRQLGDL